MRTILLRPGRMWILPALLFLGGCLKEDHFGKSAFKEITAFILPLQIGASTIDHDSLMVRIQVSEEADITTMTPVRISVSNFATIDPPATNSRDFSVPVRYTVTAEDGTQAIYTVYVSTNSSKVQLPNSGFDQWYLTANNYLQIGAGITDTIWATSNAGVNTFGKVNVVPFALSADDTTAFLETLDMGPLAQLIGQGIAAGSLFTGTFLLNIQNPTKSARFGTPFTSRPDSCSVYFRYTPGDVMKNGFGTILPGVDSVDIAVLLEDRSTEPVKRIATAWFRSSQPVEDWTLLKMKLVYGALSSPKSYEVPVTPAVWGTGKEVPTHISVIFSSSARGNVFEGAPGSKLWLNDFRLYYK